MRKQLQSSRWKTGGNGDWIRVERVVVTGSAGWETLRGWGWVKEGGRRKGSAIG